MTVVAYDGKTLASDSCSATDSGYFACNAKKLYRLKSGGMIGIAGDADARAVVSLVDNIKDENDLPSKADLEGTRTEGQYLLVLPDKSVFEIVSVLHEESGRFYCQVLPIKNKFYSVGHGEDFAKVAMSLGKTAEQAVKEACKWSLTCRPPVQTMRLEDKPKEKIKRTRHPKPSLQSEVAE